MSPEPGSRLGEMLAAADQELWFGQLTGLRSSKSTFYPEYRRKAEGLDRTVRTFARVSAALHAASEGAHRLAHSVVDALGAHYPRSWVAMTITSDVFPADVARLVASTPAPEQTHDWADLPADLRSLADAVTMDRTTVVFSGTNQVSQTSTPPWFGDRLGAPILLRGDLVGALIALLPAGNLLDHSDLSLVQVLANQLAVAIENACLYEKAQRHTQELEQHNRLLRQARRQLEDARERSIVDAERHRIAQDLHDTVAQHLISIGMHLEWCRPLHEEGSPVGERLALAKELARAAVSRIRSTIFELSPIDRVHQGDLRGALAALAEATVAPMDLPVTIQVRGTPRALRPTVEDALCGIAQEALHNVVKHAGATAVRAGLTYREDRCVLVVADDGSGDARALRDALSADGVPDGHHLGLRAMSRRAADIGGELRILRTAGGGVTIRASVPAGAR